MQGRYNELWMIDADMCVYIMSAGHSVTTSSKTFPHSKFSL